MSTSIAAASGWRAVFANWTGRELETLPVVYWKLTETEIDQRSIYSTVGVVLNSDGCTFSDANSTEFLDDKTSKEFWGYAAPGETLKRWQGKFNAELAKRTAP